MPGPPPFPRLTDHELESFRVAANRRLAAAQVGAHLRRRQGQSMEFHDHRRYLPGDDVRQIDWRASARLGRRDQALVRTFMAEERLTIALSVDTRASMQLPPALPKMGIALGLAHAVATLAGRFGDRVLLHPLFGAPAAPDDLKADRSGSRTLAALQRIAAANPAKETPNLEALHRRLPPAAVWLIVTDLYFEDEGGAWRDFLARAQDGNRWIILVELDSWPMERALLAGGPSLVDGPGLTDGPLRRDTDDAQLRGLDDRIGDHTATLWRAVRRGGLDHARWAWPDRAQDAAAFLHTRFTTEPVLQRLFRRRA